LNELSNIAYSDYTAVDIVTNQIDIVAVLPNAPFITDRVKVIGSIGIEFYQKVSGNYYLFNAGNALKIQELF
jgi:hypothetical protein